MQEQTPKQRMTKRKILSQIARIFDPLGLLLRLMPLETQFCAYFPMRLLKHSELALTVDGDLGDGTFGVTLIYGSEFKSSTVKTALKQHCITLCVF